MPDESLVVLSTFPDVDTARRVAAQLIEKKLAACANIAPLVESIYRWQGKVETGSEALVFFKLTTAGYAAFEQELKSAHPYEVPEIVALPVTRGSAEYLKWVAENCAG